MRAALMGLGLLCLSACATPQATGPAPVADSIRFSAGPCFGFCPSYSVTVEPDGSAILVPERNTSVPGETRFTVSPLQYRKLRDSFAPYRPATGAEKRIGHNEDCHRFATDHPTYDIRWTRRGQEKTELHFNAGCHDARYARLRAAIAAVPKLLDIEAMLKPAQPTR